MSNNFAALPSRQVTFSRPANVAQQPYQQIQQQQAANSGLALPYSSNPYLPGPSSQNSLALPNAAPTVSPYQTQQQQPSSSYPQSQTQAQSQPQSSSSSQTAVATQPAPLAGPSTPGPQHITAVEGIVPTLQNIVATVNLDCRLDLKTIALHARNAEYNPKRFAAVIMRIRDPKTTALIFASGKMVVTGAKSEDDSRLASRKYARIVQKLGFDAKFSEFKIQNIVGSCDVNHGQFSSYEPEVIVPGLIYRMIKPKVVLLIFVSGKIVLTGAKVILTCSWT
ncbi:uncharacterized protein B0H18DRAFT_979211 [Fomitopsis serialis]|uniref:uncharacterized protein n=1 Tax=Fomitopsis serialis TaxID=139415 RepID=UPI0020074278|nr:uncharacterized protein B0H18DRAFT_979211 [Neoantrodia serialis]KAH9934967.1 hypothetical protein B0H18DRAFT_979211 [Neoantrodia serialis]